MKKLMMVFVVGLTVLGQSRIARAQDEVPNNILYGPLLGIEEPTSFGTAEAVFRGGQTIVAWAVYSPCTNVLACTSLMKAGSVIRLVAVSDAGARTVLDRQTVQADPTNPAPYVINKKVTFQSNIIDQLVAGVVVVELEADGTVLAAGPLLRIKTAFGVKPATASPSSEMSLSRGRQ